MDINTLRYFLTVAEMEHMTQAAQHLNITQSALSISIQRLESEIGYKLFDRIGRSIRLNNNGKILKSAATTAVNAISDAITQMSDFSRTPISQIRLSCSSALAQSDLIHLLISKDYSLSLFPISENWYDNLINRELDIAVTLESRPHPLLQQISLGFSRVVIAASINHPLVGRKKITMADLAEYEFTSVNSKHSHINMFMEKLQKTSFSPNITFRGGTMQDQVNAMRTHNYLSVVQECNIKRHIGRDIVILPVSDLNLQVTNYMYYRKIDRNNPTIDKVQETIIKFFRDTWLEENNALEL